MIVVLAAACLLALTGPRTSLGRDVARGARAARTSDTPPGFWYGTDSQYVNVSGPPPYKTPVIGGAYGGYIGMLGKWSYFLRCRVSPPTWSKINSAQANLNFQKYDKGVGTAGYWFMGGPGVDPRYNGTVEEANNWGTRQAARALSNMRGLPADQRPIYPIMFMDIEFPGNGPASDNGWNTVYTSPCSGKVRHHHIPASVDRAVFNGFWGYIRATHNLTPGVYSARGTWRTIFGTRSASSVPHTPQWTFEPETSNLSNAPSGWCLRGIAGCAQFFGGVTRSSKFAVMWQFSGGGGVRNGIGDFDQIDGRTFG